MGTLALAAKSTHVPSFEGVYTSNELPHFIKNMPYAYRSYTALVEVITPYFGSSGTGQINAIFPVTAL
jgi:aromatic ring-opening dioxygenase catalytic subunit (LigB family)